MTQQLVPNIFDPLTSGTMAQLDANFAYVSGKMVSVKDAAFGAKGDGVTDDTAAIQLAINTLGALSTPSTLFFPAGIYQVSSALNVSSSVSLRGETEYNTFIRTGSGTAPIINVTTKGYLEITQLALTASVTRTAGYYIDINDSAVINVYIGHVQLSGYFGGVRWAGTSELDIDQCQFLNGTAATANGVRIDNGSDISIRHSVWSAASQIGNGIIITNCGDINLIDCNVIKGGTCLLVNPGNGQTVASLEATNCFFDSSNIGVSVVGSGTGIWARARFVSCWFSSHSQRGVILNSSSGVTDGVMFLGCEFYANTTSGLDFFSGSASKNIGVQDCVFAGNGTAINVGANHSFVRIQGCHIGPYAGFGANTNGIFFNGAFSDYNVTNNYIAGNGTNVTIGTPGSNVVFAANEGFVTANKGTTTITSGNTSVIVSHGLGVTPASSDILVTAIKTLGSASFFYVDTITSTQFTIHTNVNPAANVDFAWQIRSLGP